MAKKNLSSNVCECFVIDLPISKKAVQYLRCPTLLTISPLVLLRGPRKQNETIQLGTISNKTKKKHP